MFSEELLFLNAAEQQQNISNNRNIVSYNSTEDIKKLYPNISKEYLIYLQEIGSGIILGSQFDVKPFLFNFYDLGLDDIYQERDNILFFGDNLSGDFAGFDMSSQEGTVIEFWHDSNDFYDTHQSFKEYIRAILTIDE